jgi:hypothetical protein
MKGTWNPKTKRYEDALGNEVKKRNYIGFSKEEIEEYEEMERIQAEGGTFIERYAKELGVKSSDLFKNILENNSFARFSSIRSYEEFKMLKQTLVEEDGMTTALKECASYLDKIFGSRGFF